jgi:ribosomal protein L40E
MVPDLILVSITLDGRKTNDNRGNILILCSKCNHENEDDALFCDECGASLKIQAPRYCARCNTENSTDAKFCDKCGLPLEISNSKESMEKVEKRGIQYEVGESNDPKRLTLSRVLRWTFGVIYLLSTLGYIADGKLLSALFTLLVSILLLPPLAENFEKNIKVSISGPLRFVAACCFSFLAGITSAFL